MVAGGTGEGRERGKRTHKKCLKIMRSNDGEGRGL